MSNVRIVGVTGECARYINGLYLPKETDSSVGSSTRSTTQVTEYEKSGGKVLLVFNHHRMCWQVKSSETIGTDSCAAYCYVDLFGLPQFCPSGQWQVFNGTNWTFQSGFIVTEDAGLESDDQSSDESSVEDTVNNQDKIVVAGISIHSSIHLSIHCTTLHFLRHIMKFFN